ncbi:unnamed protein product, partial [marine sediment metagenome]
MEISIIGTGYVGIVSGACFAKFGNNIIFVDIDKEKIEKINSGITPIYENDLEDLLLKYKDNIKATDNYELAINSTDITFICVGTPSRKD